MFTKPFDTLWIKGKELFFIFNNKIVNNPEKKTLI